MLVESRGKKEDRLLADGFSSMYNNGLQYIDTNQVQQHLSSSKIKFGSKNDMICGLELADMLAVPMKLFVFKRYGIISEIKSSFTREVLNIVQRNIRRKRIDGIIEEYGIIRVPTISDN